MRMIEPDGLKLTAAIFFHYNRGLIRFATTAL